jgi:hypothetical protein
MIVTCDPPASVGGIEGRAIAYKDELSKMGHLVTVVTLVKNTNDWQAAPGGIQAFF